MAKIKKLQDGNTIVYPMTDAAGVYLNKDTKLSDIVAAKTKSYVFGNVTNSNQGIHYGVVIGGTNFNYATGNGSAVIGGGLKDNDDGIGENTNQANAENSVIIGSYKSCVRANATGSTIVGSHGDMFTGTEVNNRIEEAIYSNITASEICMIQRGSYNAIIGSVSANIGAGKSNIILGSDFVGSNANAATVISGGTCNGVICSADLNTSLTLSLINSATGCTVISSNPNRNSLRIADSTYSTAIASSGSQIIKSDYSAIIGSTECTITDTKNNTHGHARNVILGCCDSNITLNDYANAGSACLISCINTNITLSSPFSLGIGLGCYEGICQDCCIITGHLNKQGTSGNTTGTIGDAFIIGNGTSSSRANAFRVAYSGDVYGKNSFHTSGADYGELMEWLDGNSDDEDRRGFYVTMDIDPDKNKMKIRKATSADKIFGIISANASIIGNDYADTWQNMWLTDVYGETLTHMVHHEAELDAEGNILRPACDVEEPITNPDYDPDQEYIPRLERPEWDVVGMLGQIVVNDDGTCLVGQRCVCNDEGIATLSDTDTGNLVLERLDDNHIKIWFNTIH